MVMEILRRINPTVAYLARDCRCIERAPGSRGVSKAFLLLGNGALLSWHQRSS